MKTQQKIGKWVTAIWSTLSFTIGIGVAFTLFFLLRTYASATLSSGVDIALASCCALLTYHLFVASLNKNAIEYLWWEGIRERIWPRYPSTGKQGQQWLVSVQQTFCGSEERANNGIPEYGYYRATYNPERHTYYIDCFAQGKTDMERAFVRIPFNGSDLVMQLPGISTEHPQHK
jgi:hypothetical protein